MEGERQKNDSLADGQAVVGLAGAVAADPAVEQLCSMGFDVSQVNGKPWCCAGAVVLLDPPVI